MAKKTKTKVVKKAKVSVKAKSAKPATKQKAKGKSKVKPKAKATEKSGVKTKSQAASKSKVKTQKKEIRVKKSLPAKTKPTIMAIAAPVKKKVEIITEKIQEKTLKTSNGNSNNTKMRYNDKDLSEFKGIIINKLSEAKKDLDLLRSSMSHLDDHGTDDTSPTFKLMEDGSDVLTKEETAQLASRQQKFIKHLEDALMRIENKSYGVCRVTGNLIPKERLRIVPHATLSIEAKQNQF